MVNPYGVWQSGHKLNNGKYIVDRFLGGGGFGVTYKVKEISTNKFFVIKTLNYECQQRKDFQELQEKFINEAIALARCPHSNIVRVYPRSFFEDNLYCMVMEYVEGKDLAGYLDDKEIFQEKDAINIITQVGNALTLVHDIGLLHRDIKPANILLREPDLSPVLIDFGLARELIKDITLQKMTGYGTCFYAPIEEYEELGNFGNWTDVYALSATLYVLLTGVTPGLFSNVRKYEYVINKKDILVPPKKHNPNISDRVNNTILKGMALEPKDRPQSVVEWLELLDLSSNKDRSPQNQEVVQINTPPSFNNKNKREEIKIPKSIPKPSQSPSVKQDILKPFELEPKDRPQSLAEWLELFDLSLNKNRSPQNKECSKRNTPPPVNNKECTWVNINFSLLDSLDKECTWADMRRHFSLSFGKFAIYEHVSESLLPLPKYLCNKQNEITELNRLLLLLRESPWEWKLEYFFPYEWDKTYVLYDWKYLKFHCKDEIERNLHSIFLSEQDTIFYEDRLRNPWYLDRNHWDDSKDYYFKNQAEINKIRSSYTIIEHQLPWTYLKVW